MWLSWFDLVESMDRCVAGEMVRGVDQYYYRGLRVYRMRVSARGEILGGMPMHRPPEVHTSSLHV